MSYQVLARKWRPRNFGALVGQEHVVRALRHALEHGRLHHAYLLTGTRGVGKTTLARILAKCLNCETGVTAEPCGKCSACEEIDGGRFVDLLEVDAATNTRVDEMRQLLDTAQYAPTRGRYKVYVIDEVHMLSNSAFNAMLKTLEEPPEHLKFILATTDPQKIPVTVLSRCLQFNLKQMPAASVAAHLARLLDAEAVPYEADALQQIGRAAAGSMRDALSLLDQAIAHGAGSVTAESARDMLGAVDESYLQRLLEAVAAADATRVLSIADEMLSRSLSFDAALQDLAGLLLRIATLQVIGASSASDEAPDAAVLPALARTLDAEFVQLCYQIALQGRQDLPLAPDEHAGFVMTMLRMLAFRPDSASTPATSAGEARKPVGSASPAPARSARDFGGDWPALVKSLTVGGAARELARNSALVAHADGMLELAVPASMGHLAEQNYRDKLRTALEQHLGRPIALKVSKGQATGTTVAEAEAGERETRRAEADRAVQGDQFVRDLVDMFDAKVVGSRARPGGDGN
ncbi:MAG: DNA polymerase III subunit gamma/tau [Gammaproteobacteria bacterium]|nr:DNA polymerase III subunit gamma/tau [Gammaproteobacteria bacterium]MDH5352217.1 DNA polymerase III subunit gamma/tau [Betaproteobacteria bacterium]